MTEAIGVPARRQTGFTLIELVIAITLMGLTLVALYSGLRLGLNSWNSGEQHAEAINHLRAAQEFLRRQLAQSMTVYQTNEQQEQTVVFSGGPDRIEFVAPMLTHLGQGGLYRVRVETADGRLWLRWRVYVRDDPEAGELQETVLLNKVSSVEWAYFGTDPEDQSRPKPQNPPRWRSEWTITGHRPLLVRLTLNLGGQPWPDLVASLVEGPQR
ncbi:MAG: prepilin-type N-terminal cleavage/methylation domain-containing protein [Candidatus Contendobacter sp.]|jgi:general secretion pathway protein J|nr:prepilin-type N-terminal cleavage/methylation domain-containing protein [Gammaproteobacteria bacterium]MCC8992976.1 prepilin-type N-terminal cleavage/methylation domain-containing protein [Candidatus Contendobacter sp.]